MSLCQEVVSAKRTRMSYGLRAGGVAKLEGRTPGQNLLERQVGQPPGGETGLQSGLTKG